MPPKKFICKQCGHCCKDLSDAYINSVTEEDILLWQEKDREDILKWVSFILAGDVPIAYDIWFDPATGDEMDKCPWLVKLPNQEKYICSIHEVKPLHCREYPLSKAHALRTGCRGFD